MNSRNSSTPPGQRTRWWGKAALLGAALAFFGLNANAQVSAYTFLATTGTYTDIPVGAPAVDLPLVLADTYVSPVQPIGFTFVYDGVNYTQFTMSSNGFISLNPSNTASLTTNDLSSANATSRPIIAPLWDDLDGAVSTPLQAVARYSTTGTAPNRVLTVEWRNWQWNWSATGNTISFQAMLYETTGVVEFVYRQEAGTVNSASATIGIGSPTGSGSGSYLNLTSVATPAVSSTSSVTTLATKPATNTLYRFTPPTPCSGTPSAGTIPSTAGYCSPGTVVLSSTGFTTGVSGITFQWEESDDNGVGDPWANAVGGTGATTTSYTTATLTAPTSRYFRLKATCSALPGAPGYSGACLVSPTTPTYTVYNGTSYTQSFESWSNLCNTTDVPSSNWKNSPATGNNSWRRNDQGTSAAWGNPTLGIYSPTFSAGAFSARFHSYQASGGTKGDLDLYIDMSAASGNSDLKFDYINAASGDSLIIYQSTNGGTTFTRLGANITAASASWTQQTRTITSTSATTVIRIRAGSDFGSTDIGVDNLSITPPPACVAPTALSVGSITTTSASVSFTGTSLSYNYEVRTSGAAGSGPAGLVSSGPGAASPIALGGLSAATTYTVYVQGVCAGPTTSAWSTGAVFTTLCNAFTIPYNEDFSTAVAPAFPPCVSTVDVNGASSPAGFWRTSSAAFTGLTVPYAQYAYATAIGGNDWFFTPGLSLTGGTSYRVSYKYAAQSATFPEAMDVYWGNAASVGAMTNLIVDHGSFTNIAPASVQYDFTPGSTGTYYIGWHAKSLADEFNLNLDDISVTLTPTCLNPTALALANTSSTSTDLSWTCTGCSGQFIVEYGPQGYTPGTGATAGVTGTLVSSNATSPYTISGLSPLTAYTFAVRQDCGGGNYSTNSTINGSTTPDCAGAPTIACGASTVGSWTAGTGAWSAGTCGFSTPGKEVLYKFTAPVTGSYTLNITAVSSTNYVDWFFKATSGACDATGWTCIDDNNAVGTDVFSLTGGVEYYLLGDPEGTGNAFTQTFQIDCPQPPVCIANPTSPTNGGNACAGGATTLSWPAAPFATAYDVYFDAGAGPATTLVSNDQAGLTYNAGTLTAGTYSWSIVPSNALGGPVSCSTWTFTVIGAPVGASFATAIPVTLSSAGTASVSGNTLASNCFSDVYTTVSTPGSANARPGRDAFYTFTTGPCATSISLKICPTSADSRLHLLSAAGTALAFDDDTEPAGCSNTTASSLTFAATPSTQYYVVVDEHTLTSGYTFTLDIADGSPDGDSDGVADCVDNCPLVANAGQEDTDGDLIGDACDVCPLGPNPGSACNDGNPFTSSDVIQNDCSCAGTPAPSTTWTLEFTTDNAGSESTWQIVDATSPFVLDAGGPYASNTTTTENVVVPTGACFNLIVTDANGMSNGTTGGWILRDSNGKRVIDNSGDAVFAGTSQADLPFCSPVGNDAIIASQCDKVDWTPGQIIIATPNAAVTAQYGVNNNNSGYEFWFFNPDGGYSRRVLLTHANPGIGGPTGATKCAHLAYSNLQTNPVPANVLLNVRVRSVVNGAYGDFGAACRFKIDQTAANCPLTQLISTPGATFSCGATGKIVKASGNAGRIYAQPVTRVVGGSNQSANAYFFELTDPLTGYTRLIGATSYTLVLGQWYTNPLQCGTHTYNVRVRASFDGGATYCPYGAVCTVSITNNLAAPYCTVPGPMAGGDDRVFFDGDETSTEAVLTLWPNPNNGEQLYVTINALNADVTTATVDIFDLVGHKVGTHTIPVNGTTLNAVISLDASMANGMYLVNVTAGDQTFVQRLVIQ